MIAELCAVVRLELARAASPRNLVVACLCAALALGQGYLTLGAHAALTGSLGEGATAQDVFLGVACSQLATGTFLPLGVVALTMGAMGRDGTSEQRDLLVTRLSHRGCWWSGKILANLVVSVAFLIVTCVASWTWDVLANGMPMSDGAVARWLTYPDGPSSAPIELYVTMRPIPEGWNIYALEIGLAVAYGVTYAGYSSLCQALCLGASGPWAAAALSVGGIAAMGLANMVQGLGFVYDALAWLAAVPVYRLPSGRLMLTGYPLGAGVLSDKQVVCSLSDPAGFVTLPLNSAASAALTIALILGLAWGLGAWRSRSGCVHLDSQGRGVYDD